jgi:hypothetical protein
VLVVILLFYLSLRFVDPSRRGVLGLLLENRMETWLFGLEIALLTLPMLLLLSPRIRADAQSLYVCALMVLFRFVANRLNVAITGFETSLGTHTPNGPKPRSP